MAGQAISPTSGSRLDWATGDEPMTGAPADLPRPRRPERIDALQQQTGRGLAPHAVAAKRHMATSRTLKT